MKRNFRTAFNQLKKIGAPVYEGGWSQEEGFRISAEENHSEIWADYYGEYLPASYEFGVNPKITAVLDKHGLMAEWCNPGVLDVCQA